MKNKLQNIHPLTYLLTFPLLSLIYTMLNNDYGTVYSLVTDLDRMIPFNKYFILPYMLWSPFILAMLVYFCRNDRKVYFNVMVTINLGLIINYLTYSIFQTTVPRPVITGTDLWSEAVRFLYSMDKPYNCFPSGHVLTSYAVIYGCYKMQHIGRYNIGKCSDEFCRSL